MDMLEFENTSALDIELAEKVVALLAADHQQHLHLLVPVAVRLISSHSLN